VLPGQPDVGHCCWDDVVGNDIQFRYSDGVCFGHPGVPIGDGDRSREVPQGRCVANGQVVPEAGGCGGQVQVGEGDGQEGVRPGRVTIGRICSEVVHEWFECIEVAGS